MRIVVNGVGVAGPTLAWWLQRGGHEVVLVEEAPALRTGGYVIDFWGVGYDIAEKMGLIPRIRELGYQVQEVRFVDRRGRKRAGLSLDVFTRLTNGRFTSLRRSDVSATVYEALGGRVETLFGDSITGIEPRGHGVRVEFEHAAARDADLVIGADGLHSRVRRLVFGPQAPYEVPLGYHVAAFEVEGYRPREELVYVSHAVPGKQVSRFAMRDDKTLFLFVFRDEYLPPGPVATERERKSALKTVFGDVGWECPQILAALDKVSGVYFDRVSQIRMDRWSQGRTALVGDAAACVSLLAGEGTGLAMAEAYVLAGELCACDGDYGAAFARYQARVMPFLEGKQRSAANFASSFAPKTAAGIGFRNLVTRLLWVPFIADYFIGRDLRDALTLPDYDSRVAIRRETAADIAAIRDVTIAAFKDMAISRHTEHFIVAALRAANALTLSLVAELNGRVVGHIAFSPVTMSDGTEGWYGLGPLSVVPEHQRQGIGKALVREGLSRLRDMNARGCCLVGHPDYYRKFGFTNPPGLMHEGVPPEVFLALSFDVHIPQGSVHFHAAFNATGDPAGANDA